LTDYVDGTLGAADLAAVEAHLATCATCRRETALARTARSALRSLPDAAPPPGLAEAAIAAARDGAAPTSIADAPSKRPARRWIAVAAAAAVIGLVAVVSPKLGTSPTQTMADGAGGAADRSFAKADAVEVVKADLSMEQIALAAAALGGVQTTAEAAPTGDASGVSGVARADLPDLTPTTTLPERLDQASACLDQAWGATPGELTRVVLARYEGTPAYFGLYAIGPGAGLPPTRVQLLVASVDGCRGLAQGYALL
jgi:hypothetical protein